MDKKDGLLLLYKNRIYDIETSLNAINRAVKRDLDYINNNPDSISWEYLNKSFHLRNELKRIEYSLKR